MELLKNLIIRLLISAFIYYLPVIIISIVAYFIIMEHDNYYVQTERKNLFKPVTIVSTKDIVFYEIYPHKTNLPIKIAQNDYYLCIENRLSSTRVGCLEYAQGKKLPIGTEVILSGNARELNESDIGGSYHFYFFEGFSKNKRYWVDDVDLDIMFENVKKLDEFNKKAYKTLKKYLPGYLQNQE